MRKTVKTGRGTGKTYETVEMMRRDENLYTVVPDKHIYKTILKAMVIDTRHLFSDKEVDNIFKRIITIHDIDNVKYAYPNARFHIEEADWILRDLLKINFDTMTTTHWHVETFKRNEYEKGGW